MRWKSSVRFRVLLKMETRRAPPGTGTGLNSTALISVNTMVFKPIPSARVATTAAENQRWEKIIRRAKRRSFLMGPSYGMTHGVGWRLTRGAQIKGDELRLSRRARGIYSPC